MASIFEKNVENPFYDFPLKEEIALVAGISPTINKTLDSSFCAQIKRCGFNSVAAMVPSGEVLNSLQNCNKNDLKLIVGCDQLNTLPDLVVNAYKNNPGLGGWFVGTNISVGENRNNSTINNVYKAIVRTYKESDKGKEVPIFLGVDGGWGSLTGLSTPSNYANYISNFQEYFQPTLWPLFYFPDLYEIGGNPEDGEWRQQVYYRDLLYFSYISRFTATPFWLFCRCQGVNDFESLNAPSPTLNLIRGTVFMGLAHGAQGIYYWDYQKDASNKYFDAPVDANGNETKVWNIVRAINQEVKAYNPIFKGCEMIDARYLFKGLDITGVKTLNNAMGPIDKIPTVTGEKYGLLFSHLSKAGKDYIVIVRSPFAKSSSSSDIVEVKLSFNNYWSVSRLTQSGDEMYIEPLTNYSPSYSMAPGDYLIFAWE